MAKAETPMELYLLELGDMLWVERRLTEVLPQLAEQSSDVELRDALEHHLQQTRSHVTRVEEAFRALGHEPKAEPCPTMKGLDEEHEETIGKTAPALHDHVVLSSAAATEHYEISSYDGLIETAKAMGHDEVVTLLTHNLEEEKQTLEHGQEIMHRLAQHAAQVQAKEQKSLTDKLMPGR